MTAAPDLDVTWNRRRFPDRGAAERWPLDPPCPDAGNAAAGSFLSFPDPSNEPGEAAGTARPAVEE